VHGGKRKALEAAMVYASIGFRVALWLGRRCVPSRKRTIEFSEVAGGKW
jgi:hypothetical protein